MTKQRVEILEEIAAAAIEIERTNVGHSDVCHARLNSKGSPYAYSGGCICGRDRLRAAILALRGLPDEPSADYRVQCKCGWMGKTSELVTVPYSQGKNCPKCRASFRTVT